MRRKEWIIDLDIDTETVKLLKEIKYLLNPEVDKDFWGRIQIALTGELKSDKLMTCSCREK